MGLFDKIFGSSLPGGSSSVQTPPFLPAGGMPANNAQTTPGTPAAGGQPPQPTLASLTNPGAILAQIAAGGQQPANQNSTMQQAIRTIFGGQAPAARIANPPLPLTFDRQIATSDTGSKRTVNPDPKETD